MRFTPNHLLRRALLLVLATCTLPAFAQANAYPSKPVRIVVPWAAGTGTDLNARAIAQQITATSGQTAVVENRPGAVGSVGTGEVNRAPADGYTVLATSNAHIANLFLMKNLPYDPLQDFIPVSGTRKLPSLIVARPGLGVKSLAELTELAKRQPGKISFGAGTSAGRIGMELFQEMTGTKLLHVPYKGATAALTDLLGGHVDVMFIDIFNVLSRVKDGRVVALAATGKTRLKVLPDLMTAAEAGLPGYDVGSWSGLWVRKGTPPEAIAFLNRMAKKGAEAEKEQVETAGGEVFITTQPEFARYIESEAAMWKKITTNAKIVPE